MTFSQRVGQGSLAAELQKYVQLPQLVTLEHLETTRYFSFLINRINVGTNHRLGRWMGKNSLNFDMYKIQFSEFTICPELTHIWNCRQHNGAVLLPAAGALGYHWSKQSVLLPLQLLFFPPLSVSAKQVKKQLSENSFLNFVSVELCSSLYSCLHWIQWITLYAPYVAIAQIRIIRREIAVAMHISGKETHQWLQINSELGSVILPSPLCRASQRAGWEMGGDGVRCIVQPLLEEISGFCGNLPNTRSTDSASVCASLQHFSVLTLNTVQTATASIRLWRWMV